MAYIFKRFCDRLGSFDAWKATTNDTDKLDKSIKGVEGFIKPIFEVMSLSDGYIGKVGKTGLGLPFFQFLVTVGKNLMAPAFIGKTPIWWMKDFKAGLTWDKFFSTIGNPFLQVGNLMDTLMFAESMGFVSNYDKATEQIGKIPLFGGALTSLGLKGVKAYSVMISSALSTIGVGVFIAYRAFARDRNIVPNRAKIEEENEKLFANFFNSTSKGLVVWMVYRLGNKNPFRFIGGCLFVSGAVLMVTNLWKYVMNYQDGNKKEKALLVKGHRDNEYLDLVPHAVSEDKRVLAELAFSNGG